MSAHLELELVELLDRNPRINKKQFLDACTKIADIKWMASMKPRRELNAYQLFVKANMKYVIDQNPEACHGERMRMLGEMWRQVRHDQDM